MIKLKATIENPNGDNILIDSRNAISMERNIQDRSDFELPSFGIISNSGNLKFVDMDGSIKKLAEFGQLKNGMQVYFIMEDTTAEQENVVCKMFTKDWNYDVNNKQISVKMHDGLEDWQNIPFPKSYYQWSTDLEVTAKEIYNKLYEYVPDKYNMPEFSQLDEQTREVLSRRYTTVWICDAPTLWSVWNEFCKFAQLHIYINAMGNVVCKYNGGN